MPTESAPGSTGDRLGHERLCERARRVAKYLSVAVEDLTRGAPGAVDEHADFVDRAYAALFPEPWLAFVECVHRAVLDSRDEPGVPEGSLRPGSQGAQNPAALARRYFHAIHPDLAELAWPRLQPGKNAEPLMTAVASWSQAGDERLRWEAIQEAVRCFHPGCVTDLDARALHWESMSRQWQRHARHKFLPNRARGAARVPDEKP